MAPESWPNDTRELPRKKHYNVPPRLAEDEEFVEFREPVGRFVYIARGEIIIGTEGQRYPYGSRYAKLGKFGSGIEGRYVVRKKNTAGKYMGTCEKCGEPYVVGGLAQHRCKAMKAMNPNNPEVEVVMAEQKPLSYKRDTLIEVLQNAVTENERKREEDKRKKLEKDRKAVDQMIAAIKMNPRFAQEMLRKAAALVGAEIRSSEDVGSEAFKESVKKHYPDPTETETEPDADLKKLIRVYEKAEDETVEVHVHDTVYNYL